MAKIEVSEQTTLKWPDGWPRTRVNGWTKKTVWKHTRAEYMTALVREIELMGATAVLITRSDNERLDPGVAVWFSMQKEEMTWQDTLGIDSPAPTLAEIDEAFKAKAMKNHPDRGGDAAIYQRISDARAAAKAWVMGTHEQRHDFVMALDIHSEARWNMAGLRLAFANFRSLKRLGMPSILERTMQTAFKAALPMQAGGSSGTTNA